LLIYGVDFLKRIKLWEWLLIAVVILLGVIAYELLNAPGKYVVLQQSQEIEELKEEIILLKHHINRMIES